MTTADGDRNLANLLGVSQASIGSFTDPDEPWEWVDLACPGCEKVRPAKCSTAPGRYAVRVKCECGEATEHVRIIEPNDGGQER